MLVGSLLFTSLFLSRTAPAADHNDPIAINSIFDQVPVNAADLYDLFGFPSDDKGGGEKVVIALTFASVPATGAFDPDLLYVIKIDADPRVGRPTTGDQSWEAYLAYIKEVRERFLKLKASAIRVTVAQDGQATLNFLDFPGTGPFTRTVATNQVATIDTPDGHAIKAYIGGRDDAFFNDLPGFFRSINYAPQFYKVPQSRPDLRELKIPKTLLELEGNHWFNVDPALAPGQTGPNGIGRDVGQPDSQGHTRKLPLPPETMTWGGNSFRKVNGNYRFVYSGKDAQAGINVNAIIFEIPLAFLTRSPQTDRVVNTWGESWVRTASGKIASIPDVAPGRPFWKRPWVIPGVVVVAGIALVVLGVKAGRRRAAARRRDPGSPAPFPTPWSPSSRPRR